MSKKTIIELFSDFIRARKAVRTSPVGPERDAAQALLETTLAALDDYIDNPPPIINRKPEPPVIVPPERPEVVDARTAMNADGTMNLLTPTDDSATGTGLP